MSENIKMKKNFLILSILLCLVTLFGVIQYRRAAALEYAQNIEYNRVFTELTEYVDDIEISLLKGQLVKSPIQTAHFSSELYRQASGAKANLALLPMESNKLEKTSEFLSQVGEYASAISQKVLRGEEISDEENANLEKLTGYAKSLRKNLDEMLSMMNDGKINFSDKKNLLPKIMNEGSVAMASGFEKLEEEFHNYPSLIYDGPFSQHLSLKESVFTNGKPEISRRQALEIAKKFIGNGDYYIDEIEGKLPAYSVKGGGATVEITKKGGVLLLLMKDVHPAEEKLSLKQAKSAAKTFLSENGFDSMTESYYESRDGSAVFNYAYSQNGYIVYPDLVKVKVSLESGEIIGFESRGYIMNHSYRDIPQKTISEDEALSNVRQSLSVSEITDAVIPLEDGSEACCYQLKGKVSDKHFLIFVNVTTGDVEDMQILLETPGGVLAV